MSEPYPKVTLELWADRWFPRFIWLAVVAVLVIVLARAFG